MRPEFLEKGEDAISAAADRIKKGFWMMQCENSHVKESEVGAVFLVPEFLRVTDVSDNVWTIERTFAVA